MKYVLLICTKNVLFSLDNKLYTQKDDIAMESPIGSVITGIYIVDFEKNVIPQSSTQVTCRWYTNIHKA